jgi:hypothetical protein
MNAGAPIPSVAECIQFMRFWIDVTEVPHITLIAIAPDFPIIVARTFAPADFEAAVPWIAEQQAAERNVYFQPNETAPRCNHKPGKADMVAAQCRFADIDPVDEQFPLADERSRLVRLADYLSQDPKIAPTAIIDSGNGIQALWAVTREILSPEAVLRVEAETRAIEAALGAGGTHNIDRLLRLPGTVNYPNSKKKSLGRSVSRARLVFSASNLYAPHQAAALAADLTARLADIGLIRPKPVKSDEDMSTAISDGDWAPLATELKAAGADRVSRMDHLPPDLRARLPEALEHRTRLADRWAGKVDDLVTAGHDATRSGADISVAAMAKAAGFSHLEAGLILCAFPHGKANNDEWPNADLRLRHVARCVLHSHEPEATTANQNAETAELPSGFRMTGKGLFFDPEPTTRNPDPPSVFVAAHFQIVGQSRSDIGENWGLLLSWYDRDAWCTAGQSRSA